MGKLLDAGGLALLGLLAASAAEAGGVAVTGRASSLGLGVELTAGLSDRLNVRVGGNMFDYDRRLDVDENTFDIDLEFRSYTALVDVHPSAGGFRLSGGFVANGNEAGMVGRSTDSYVLGGTTYSAAAIGALTGSVDFKKAAAYAGIGWGNAVRDGRTWGLVFDLGVVFQGAPDITLGATGPIAASPEFQADLRQEELDLEDDAREFRYYPVISLGLSYKF